MSIERDRTYAQEQLTIAEQARGAARGPRPVPGFLPPVAGLLVAGGFAWFAVAVHHAGQWIYPATGVSCLVVFLVLAVLSSRAGGIVSRPHGSPSRRTTAQLLAASLPFVLGGIAAIFFGLAGWLAGFGVGLGVVACAQLDRARRGDAR